MTDSRNNTPNSEIRAEETSVLVPPVDVVEDAAGITLYADLPGVPKEKLDVHIEADNLTIRGEILLPVIEGLEPTHTEVGLPRYQRSFTLSRELDMDRVHAEFNHGVLVLRIPRAEQAKARRIQVSVD